MEGRSDMDPATAQVLVSAVIRGLDLIGRVAEKQFDNKEELEAYIAERNQVRKELVAHALELGGGDPAEPEQAEPAGDDLAHGYRPAEQADPGVHPEPSSSQPSEDQEQPPSDEPAESDQSDSDQEEDDAASSAPSQD